MSALGDVLRSEIGVSSKYRLEVVDGSTDAPHTVHVDGWTRWKNGVPKEYTRAVNKLQVGLLWLEREFPATFALHKLNGGVRLPERVLPYELEWRQWIREHKDLALRCANLAPSRERDRTLDADEDRRLFSL